MWALRFTLCELESVLYFIWLRRRVHDSRTEPWSGPHGPLRPLPPVPGSCQQSRTRPRSHSQKPDSKAQCNIHFMESLILLLTSFC